MILSTEDQEGSQGREGLGHTAILNGAVGNYKLVLKILAAMIMIYVLVDGSWINQGK